MSAGKSKGVRRLARLAWLALVASLLATVPGAAQAQDNTASNPLANAPTVVSAGPSDYAPHHVIAVVWELSFPEDPDNPVNRTDTYIYEIDIAPDQDGAPGDWVPFTDLGAARIATIDKEQDATSGVTTVTLGARLLHSHQLLTDKYHYRTRINGPASSTPWSTVGPLSTAPLPATPTPTDFTAAPSTDDPQTKVVLSWDPVPTASADKVFYRLDMLSTAANAWQSVDNIEATTYEQVFAVSDKFSLYRLWAVRDYGDRGPVESEAVSTEVTPSVPPTPTEATASTDSDNPSTAVVISWTGVPVEAGSALYYQLRFRDVPASGGISEWSEPGPLRTSSTTFDHDGRAPATTYEYRVRAVREGYSTLNYSEWSETATVTTDAAIGGL